MPKYSLHSFALTKHTKMKPLFTPKKFQNHFLLRLYILSVLFLTGVFSANAAVQFAENKGQWNEQAKYRSDLPGGNVFLTNDGFMFTFFDSEDLKKGHDASLASKDVRLKCHTYKVTFKNSSTVSIKPGATVPGYSNYYIGNDPSKWASHVNAYSEVLYENLYPNIDLKVYSVGESFKYDLILHPGARISDIIMHEEGVENIFIKGGSLVYQTSVGNIAEKIPAAYIVDGSKQKKVECNYKINGHDITFDINGVNIAGREFVIDPALVFSTFSCSTASAFGCNGSFDSSGKTFGSAVVNGQGWPTSFGAYDISYAGSTDVGIHKFDPVNAGTVWATYLGGFSTDVPLGMLCNSTDELFVFGTTSSSDFPVGSSAYDATYNGMNDMFVSKLSYDGTQLLGSTYVGGANDDGANNSSTSMSGFYETAGDLFIDPSGNPVVGCYTMSTTDFPSVGGYQPTNGGGADGCIFKLNSSLSSMLFSTFLGGISDDIITAICENAAGDIVVTGATLSNNFPVTAGVYQGSKVGVGDIDGFISVLNSGGSGLTYSTYFGPTTSGEKGFRVAVNSTGNIFVFGGSLGTVPVSPSVYTNQNTGTFLAKFDPALATLMLCTAYGNGLGALCLIPSAFKIDDCDHILCAGFTTSTSGGAYMPTTPNAFQATSADYQDIYVNIFTRDMDTLLYGSYIGSPTYEHSHGGYDRFDDAGNLYYALCTQSAFPITNPTYCSTSSGGYDMICFKMSYTDLCVPSAPPVPDFICSQTNLCPGACINFTNYSTNATSYLWNFPGGTPSTSTAANPTGICYSAPGTYNITLTASNSGGSASLTQASLINVFVPVPVTLVQIGDTIFATTGFIMYQWYYNGVPVTSGVQPWLVPTQNGTYSVTALDPNDCASEFTLPNVIASVDALNSNQGISIYPNPNSGSFTIEIATGMGWKEFTLTDVTGKIIISEKIEGNKIVIDRRKVSLASAVYLCRFRSDTGSATRKIIIE